MSERIRFHLDEHIDPDIARALRRYGIDVTTTVEMNLRTRSDEMQWQFICQQQRVLVTQDRDFLSMASRTSEHPGIAYCRPATRSIGEMIEALILIYEVYGSEEMMGCVEYL